jgi:hypothetical protein
MKYKITFSASVEAATATAAKELAEQSLAMTAAVLYGLEIQAVSLIPNKMPNPRPGDEFITLPKT